MLTSTWTNTYQFYLLAKLSIIYKPSTTMNETMVVYFAAKNGLVSGVKWNSSGGKRTTNLTNWTI